MKHVVLGWARGGLGYVTELLRSSGADTHVGTTFGPDTTAENLEQRLSTAKDYEVSPYLVPFLGHPAISKVKVTFVVRDPMRVLNSIYFHGLFHNEKQTLLSDFSFKHLTGFKGKYLGCPGQAVCAYLWNWYRLSKERCPQLYTVRVEEGPAVLRKHFGLPPSDKYVEPYKGISYCKQTLLPSQLPENGKEGVRLLLNKLGYRETHWEPRGGHAHYVNPDWHC